MGGAIGGAERGVREMGVDLGRRQAGVAEQLLDRAQIRPSFQQVRGEGVAQGVRTGAGRGAGGSHPPLDHEPCPSRAERAAGAVEEHRRARVVGASGEQGPPVAEVTAQCRGRRLAK